MRINQVVDKQYHTLLDDKAFIRQFSILLALIVAISLFLIYYSIKRVDYVDLLSFGHGSHYAMTLGEVERSINGNMVSLEVMEDNFSDLAEMDLQRIAHQQGLKHRDAPVAVKAPAAAKRHIADSKPMKKSRIHIEITSAPAATKRRAPSVSLKHLRKRFYQTNDVKYALAIAKRLSTMKKYKEALKWSLIANEIAPESAKSWTMFADIKLKMGKKKDAINVLRAYLKTYDSAKVSRMLKKIERS